jgi:hypothetical protein
VKGLTALRALKHQVLNEVRHTLLGRGFVAAARVNNHSYQSQSRGMHGLVNQAQSVGKIEANELGVGVH